LSGIEMPGYSRLFLQNRTPAQKRGVPARQFFAELFLDKHFRREQSQNMTEDRLQNQQSIIC
jgi:hypothetical protein